MKRYLHNKSWRNLLINELNSLAMARIEKELDTLQEEGIEVYPHRSNVFRALDLCPPEQVKVVIIGQDPYHTPGLADGLAFSTGDNPPSPSLKNIFIEANVESEYGDLSSWAQQGVLLLNTVLTVEAGNPGSHRGMGWEDLTDAIVTRLNEFYGPIIFMLWGKDAKSKRDLITNPRHYVLTASHPSPFSVDKGFKGCDHFNKANEFLVKNFKLPIEWDTYEEEVEDTEWLNSVKDPADN